MTKKSGGWLALTLILIIVAFLFVGLPKLAEINIPFVSPGAEGVNLYIDGLQLPWAQTYYRLQNYGPNQVIYDSKGRIVWDWFWATNVPALKLLEVRRISAANPKSITIQKQWLQGDFERGSLQIEVSRPEIDWGIGASGLDAQGVVPSGYSAGVIKSVEYSYLAKEWNETVGDKVVTYQQWNKTVVNIVPVDFVIQFSCVPGGHRDIGWKNTIVWFTMDFTVWWGIMKDYNPPNGTGWELKQFEAGGGFPIFAWVSGWDAWVQQAGSQNIIYNKMHNAETSEGQTAALPSDVSEDKYVRLDPGFVGREISLLNSDPASSANPGTYQLLLSKDVLENAARGGSLDQLIAQSVLPKIPRGFSPTVWFAITLVNYGPYSKDNTAWYNPWKWSDYETWYPASYMRVRVLYAVWGSFTYLWTKEEAQRVGYTWENRTSQHTKEGGPDPLTAFLKGLGDWWNGALQWLSNPFNQIWMFFIIIVIVIIVVSVMSPGVWTALAHRKRNGG